MIYDSRPDTYKHISRVRELLSSVVVNFLARASRHDASKLEPPELATFDEFTPKLGEMEYGSDEYRACVAAMGPALEHHYAHNSHHPEHYPEGCRGMSLFDLLEMLCDWKAASERMRPSAPAAPGRPAAPNYSGFNEASLDLNRQRFGYSDELHDILVNTAREMGWL